MKHEPIDHLGRPRRSAGSLLWLIVQLLLGLAAGAVSGIAGAWLSVNQVETYYLALPPIVVIGLLAFVLFALERAGHDTGYIVIMGSYAVGLAVAFAAGPYLPIR